MNKTINISWSADEIKNILERKENVKIKWLNINGTPDKYLEAELNE